MPSAAIDPKLQDISEVFSKHDLKIIGITNNEHIHEDRAHVAAWQENGFASGMQYMLKPAEQLASPTALWKDAKTIISVALFYGSQPVAPIKKGFGQVARYAWGKDYHQVFKENLQQVVEALGKFGSAKVFSDSVPLLERAIAAKSGNAFIGKNSLCILPREGSFFLLAEIFLGFYLKDYDASKRMSDKKLRCGTCVRCISDCPTGALVSPRVLDANRCISYLTIEHRGEFSDSQARMLGDWMFGCDVCQEVCPYNVQSLHRKDKPSALLRLTSEKGETITHQQLDILEMLTLKSNREFEKRFKDSPIVRARRFGIIRNAIAVARNQNFCEITPLLKRLQQYDESRAVKALAASTLNNENFQNETRA